MKKIKKSVYFILTVAVCLFVYAFGAFADNETVTVDVKNAVDGVAVSWTSVPDAYYYELYRQSNDGSKEALLTKAQDLSFVDTQAVSGTIYGYRVSAVSKDGEQISQSGLSIIYRIGATKITNQYSSASGLHIEWNAVKEAKGYYILRQTQKDEKWKVISKCSASQTSFVDSESSDDEKYYYAVRAFAGEYVGEAENKVTLSYIPCPELISIVSVKDGIGLKWSSVSTAAYYVVYRREAGVNWKPYALLDAEYTSYIDKDVKDSVAYAYVVRAADLTGQLSPYDSSATMKHIEKPVITSAESTLNGIKLKWSVSDGCQGYAVYRKEFGTDEWKLLGLVKGETNTQAVDSKVVNSKAYTYTVRAVWNKNLSSYDENGATVRFLEAPQNLLCDADTANGNVLTWKSNPSASMFFVFRKGIQGKWKAIGITKSNSFADKKADPKEVYKYTVRAYKSSTYISGLAQEVSTGKVYYGDDAKYVALSYDDGPSDSVTNAILDILEQYDARATFFVIGQNIEYGKDAMIRAAKMGCEIGTHTYSHIDLPSSSEEEIRKEIEMTDELVKKYTGQPTKVARAPGGAIDDVSGKIVGKPFFYWSVDTRDWESRDAASVIQIVKENVADGDIILMHDIYESTLEASEYVIPWLVSEGYHIVTVSELMEIKSKNKVQPGVTYYNGFDAD